MSAAPHDADGQPDPDGDLRYEYKPSLMGAAWELRLRPDALEWRTGRHHGRIPYDRVTRVRLSFRPVTMQTRRFVTEIWWPGARRLSIASTSWRSLVEQAAQDQDYGAFVRDLHARVRPRAGRRRSRPACRPCSIGRASWSSSGWRRGFAVLTLRALELGAYSGAGPGRRLFRPVRVAERRLLQAQPPGPLPSGRGAEGAGAGRVGVSVRTPSAPSAGTERVAASAVPPAGEHTKGPSCRRPRISPVSGLALSYSPCQTAVLFAPGSFLRPGSLPSLHLRRSDPRARGLAERRETSHLVCCRASDARRHACEVRRVPRNAGRLASRRSTVALSARVPPSISGLAFRIRQRGSSPARHFCLAGGARPPSPRLRAAARDATSRSAFRIVSRDAPHERGFALYTQRSRTVVNIDKYHVVVSVLRARGGGSLGRGQGPRKVKAAGTPRCARPGPASVAHHQHRALGVAHHVAGIGAEEIGAHRVAAAGASS